MARALFRLESSGTRKRVLDLAGPSLVEMFLISAVHMIDMMMVGRVGPAAIAAVGLSSQPIMFFQATSLALNVGTTALVARLMGAGDVDTASEAARQTLVVSFVLGIIMGATAILCARPILLFMGAEPEVLVQGVTYFRLVGAGILFNSMAMNMTASLRGAGDTRSPMSVNMIANLFTLCGNYVLINGYLGFPRLEVVGAGVANLSSRFLAFALFFYILASGSRRIKPRLSSGFRFDWPLLVRAFRVGIPAACEQLILRSGQVTFARVVASLGTATFASHQIAMNVLSMSFMPGQAFAVAATTLVGQGLGADRPDESEKSALEARRTGVIVACTMAGVFFFFGRHIAQLYTTDAEVIARTAMVLRLYAFAQPAQSTQFILAGALRGAGDSRWPLYSSAVGIWFGRVLMAWALINFAGLGLAGAWLAMALDQVGRSLITSLRFRSGRWKSQEV